MFFFFTSLLSVVDLKHALYRLKLRVKGTPCTVLSHCTVLEYTH